MDPHFARMLNSSRTCSCCGATFAQLLGLSCDRPDICPDDFTVQDNSAVVATRGDVLTEDFCRLGELHFIRAVLAIPIADGGDHEFILGSWAGVSRDDFERYMDALDMQDGESLGTFPAWLSNSLPITGHGPIACMVHMRPDGEYPEMQISEPRHQLAQLQEIGMGLEDLLQILHAYGHDLASLVYDS